MNFYHRTHPTAALNILARGFTDSGLTKTAAGPKQGVWLSDLPWAEDERHTALVCVEVDEEAIADFEDGAADEQGNRRWIVPADLLNRVGTKRRLVENDGGDATAATVLRIEQGTPPHHAARIYSEIGEAGAASVCLQIGIAVREGTSPEGILAQAIRQMILDYQGRPQMAFDNALEGFCDMVQKFIEAPMRPGGALPDDLAESRLHTS